jgi:coproporphyrinogen III oxidase-like Fe-S oxidoreductase
LRQLKGIDLDHLERQYNPWFRGDLRRRIAELESQGLVQSDGGRIRLAPERLAVSNEVFVALLD